MVFLRMTAELVLRTIHCAHAHIELKGGRRRVLLNYRCGKGIQMFLRLVNFRRYQENLYF